MTFERVLYRIRQLVRERDFIITSHAEEELESDGFTVLDVESVIFSGTIVHHQLDPRTRERKYVFSGLSLHGHACGLVAKIGITGKAVIITVYAGTEVRYDM